MTKWQESKFCRRLKYKVLMEKIFAFLESGKYTINIVRIGEYAKTNRLLGFVRQFEKKIYIDVRSDLVPTLIHECLHVLLENWDANMEKEEDHVMVMEKYLAKRLTEEDILKLLSYICTKETLLAKTMPLVYDSAFVRNKLELEKLLKP